MPTPPGHRPASSYTRRFLLGLLALFCLLLAPLARSAGPQKLHGHVPAAVSRLASTGHLDRTKVLHLAIGLPPRNPAALNTLLQDLYNPASPSYHKYLTPAEFAAQFGPTESDYQTIVAFAKAQGLKVTGTHPNRLILDVQGTAAVVEKALHVSLQTYNHPTEGRQFFAPDSEPSLDLGVPILHISGLDNYSLPHPKLKPKPAALAALAQPMSGSAPGGAYAGGDFRAAYVPGTSLTGTGQSVALLQFDGYYASDIANYRTQFGLPNIPLVNVAVDGGVSTPTSNNVEVCLDIEMVMSMAPGVSTIYVYEAPNPSPWVDLLSKIANDNLAKQISCSWGGGSADPASEAIFQQMATQGQSFFNASGDSDAFTGAVPFPADSPNVTEVGATTLTTTGAGGAYVSETVWNWGGGTGSSGGVSTVYSIPSWQTGINMTANLGSTSMRNIPDVALTGDNVYVSCNNGSSETVGGTSCAAPLWAAFTALINQQALANGRTSVGFLNPAIYSIGTSAAYSTDFSDTTTGNNFNSSSPNKYPGVSGYDLCTGWGTPKGAALITALAGPPDPLQVTSASFAATGPVGGPFSPSSQTYTLTNNGTSPINWTATATQPWLTLSSTGATLGPGATTTVTATINSAANTLAQGNYADTITFTDVPSGMRFGSSVTLRCGQRDYFTELFTAGNDTSNQSWLFTPNASSNFYSVLRTPVTSFPTDPTGGTSLTLGDDTYAQVTPTGGVSVQLYGASYTTFYVGSNGYITFRSGDYALSESLAAHFNQPRISALFDDLLPTTGQVTCKQTVDRVAVTWQGVPEYGTSDSNSFQIEMFFDGRIRITCLGIAAHDGLIGLSQGLGTPSDYVASDFDTYPATQLALNFPTAANENAGVVAATVSLSPAQSSAVSISLASSNTGKVTVPATVTIPAGQTSVPFNMTIVDNAVLDGTQVITVTATATSFTPAARAISIQDDETATLSVTAPATVSEGIGSVQGTVSVSGAPTAPISVTMSSSDTTAIRVPATVTIPAGQTSVTFTITVVDDNRINGTHAATMTAHVANWTDGTATIAVQDNESTNLALTLPSSVVEGGTGTGTVSISGTLTSPLTVSLASNTTSRLTVPAGVTIPAGATSATFTLTAPDNTLTDGTANVTITAGAAGFTSASNATNVLDNDPHHFTISTIASPQTRGTAFGVTIIAKDVNDVPITTYTGTAVLSAAGTAGADSITPAATTSFTAGVWTGNVTVNTFDTNIVLTVNDGAGHTGASNPFNVGVGALHHFAWNAIASPQSANSPFNATVTAKDSGNNTVTTFNGTAALGGYAGSGVGSSSVIITEINPNTPDEIEFMNVSTTPVDVSGWQVYIYDEDAIWPNPKTVFTIPAGTTCAAGQIFRLQEFGTAPGVFPQFYYGINISWTSGPGSHIAVLLRNASGAPIDFVCADAGTPASITLPQTIPASLWSGAQIAAPSNTSYGYSRIGNSDNNTAGDWITTIPGMGVVNAGLNTPFPPAILPVGVTPNVTGSFVNGTWNGNIAITQSGSQIKLRADDGAGHTGDSNAFDITGALSISVPATATEGDGVLSGSVSVSVAPAAPLQVSLSSSDTTAAQAPATVTIPAGQTTVSFPLTVVDDQKINGTHVATITAHIAGWTDASASVSIADNENTNLTVALPSSVPEGGTGTGTVSISGTLTTPLTVSLASDTTARLTVPASVTIPAGSTSATFALTAPDNSVVDGNAIVTLTAGATGFTGGSATTSVLDNDADHFSFSVIASPQTKNSSIPVTITARDASNAIVGGFVGTVALTTNGAVSVAPVVSGTFANGVWTGSISISDIASGVIVTATGPGGATGQSNAFDVAGNDYDYAANWPTFGNGPAHTGYQPTSGNTLPYHTGWTVTYATSTGGLNQIAISRGKAFVTPYTYFGDSFLSTVDASTGAELWRYPFTSSYSVNPPTANAGKVYVQKGNSIASSGDSKLWCFDAASGSPVWSASFGAQWERYLAPTVVNDGVWVDGGYYGGLYGYNTADGSQRFFNSSLEQYDEWTPAYYNGTIYTWIAGNFRAHDPLTGAILWTLNLGWNWSGWSMNRAPAIDQGRAFVIGNPNLYAIDLTTHTSPWSATGTFAGSPAVANGVVYAMSSSGVVSAYNEQTGATLGSYLTGGATLQGQPIVTNDSLIVTSSSATYIFNLQTHALIQTIANGGYASLANGVLYLAGSDGILRTFYPDSMASLALAVPSSVTEGAVVSGTVTLSRTFSTDTVLTLTSTDPARLTVPATVTIPAGQLSATFIISTVDDTLLNGSENVGISADGPGGQILGKLAIITVNDNEVATLAVTAPTSVSEAAGTATGTVTINAVPSSNISVALSSSDTTSLTVPATVTIPAGQTSANFTITIINDNKINGSHPATITAHVANWTDGAATVNILDDENANLTLSLPAQLTEGSSYYSGYVGISGTLSSALTVTLSANNSSRLTVPATVTIPAGSTSAYFTLTAPDNSIVDGDVPVTVTASAAGFTSATSTTTVLDNDVDHFTFSTIAAQEIRGAPFSVAITARTASGGTATGYSGSATLTASGTGGNDAVTPTTTAAFVGGVWTANITVNSFDSNVMLTVNDGAGHTGSSSAFTVGVGAVDHFAWSTQPAARSVNIPFTATITAQDAGNNTVTSFTGTAGLSLVGTPAEVRTIGTGTGQYVFPLYASSLQTRDEIIYLHSDLGAAGTINSLALSVSTAPGLMSNFTIRMKHTALSTLPSTGGSWDGTGWTTVYQGSPTISSTGWSTFTFTTPFAYDGTSNLLIDFSHNATTTGSFGVCNSTGSTRNGYWYEGSGNPDPLTWSGTSPAPGSTNGVPNLQLGIGGSFGVTAVSPSTTGSFVGGVWTGSITAPQTAVHVVLRANDGSGHTSDSNAFDVLGSPPGATTLAASAISATGVTLNGIVNANGALSSVAFDYGTTTAYGATIAGTPSTASGLSGTSVAASVTGLTPGATYHFRVRSVNSYGTTNGSDLTFTTLSNNANLANLILSSGTLAPSFSSGTTSYTASVSNTTATITLTPTVTDNTATAQVNGSTVASGNPSSPISLTVGSNTITALVTAQDGLTTMTYSVAVTRRTHYQDWAAGLGLSGTALDPMGDYNHDGLKNILKWAYATDTTAGVPLGPIQVSGGVLVGHGVPTVYTPDGVHYFALFGRRKDAATVGLTYGVDFSSDLSSWAGSIVTPTIIAQDGEIEAVTIPFPTPPAGQTQTYFHVRVTGQ